jgi:hypothetical protein
MQFIQQANQNLLIKSNIPVISDKIYIDLELGIDFLKTHYYLNHPMSLWIKDEIDTITISYHLFGIGRINNEPSFVLKPYPPLSADRLTLNILSNNLIFMHEEILTYFLHKACNSSTNKSIDFNKIEAIRDLDNPFGLAEKYNEILTFDKDQFLIYVNGSDKFDNKKFYTDGRIWINPIHKKDNLPYFRSYN